MSTARASSVFLSSYRNTGLNQLACVFALGYFLNISTVNFLNRPSVSLCSGLHVHFNANQTHFRITAFA